ncbi:hypothetical protein V8G54_028142, partial [Vigna mungo]
FRHSTLYTLCAPQYKRVRSLTFLSASLPLILLFAKSLSSFSSAAMADVVTEAGVVADPTQLDVKLFNRWSFEDIQVNDISLADYIGVVSSKHATYVPHTSGRYSVKRFRKAQCPIVERLTNSLMMHGRNNGKKLLAVRIIKHAMEIIHLLTDQNPIQVIVDAVINRYVLLLKIDFVMMMAKVLALSDHSPILDDGAIVLALSDHSPIGPREDATRIGSAGVVRRQAVDISPLRRVNQAIYLLTTGAREAAFRNIKTIAECLADELINAAKGSSNRCFLISVMPSRKKMKLKELPRLIVKQFEA